MPPSIKSINVQFWRHKGKWDMVPSFKEFKSSEGNKMLTERTENSTNGFERHFDQMLLFMEPSLSTSRLDCCILFHHLHTWSQWQHLLQLFFQLITYLVFPTSSNSSVHITLSCPVKVKVKSLSCVQLFVTLWTVACQAPQSMGFSRQEYWNGLPFPSPGDPPDPGTKPCSPNTAGCLSHQESPTPLACITLIHLSVKFSTWDCLGLQ